MSTFTEYPQVRPAIEEERWGVFFTFAKRARRHMIQYLRGKLNVAGEFTIKMGTTTTDVYDSRISKTSCIVLQPVDLISAGRLQYVYIDPALYQSGRTDTQTPGSLHAGLFVVTHNNNALADSDFRYMILG